MKKNLFHENHLWGTPAAFFEKIALLENIFYHTSSDSVLPSDFEYHLSFAIRCYFKGKNRDFWGKKQGFGNHELSPRWQTLFRALLSIRSHMDKYSPEIWDQLGLRYFYCWKNTVWLIFFSFSCIKVRNKVQKTLFITYGQIQLDELIPNMIFVLLQKDALFAKIGIWRQKRRFLGGS